MIFVDGVDIGDVADVALRDRRMLSADGIFIIVATVSEQDGSSVVPPEVLARGVPFLEGNSAFIDELREAVEDSLDRAAEQQITEIDVLESFLHDDLATFIYERLKRRPMVLAGRRRGLIAALAAGAQQQRDHHEHEDARRRRPRTPCAASRASTIRPPSRKPTPGIAAPSDSSRPDIRAW